jgi:hypothetical protein
MYELKDVENGLDAWVRGSLELFVALSSARSNTCGRKASDAAWMAVKNWASHDVPSVALPTSVL